MQRGPYAILKISTETGEIIQISPDYGFVIGHLQANPVKPDMISYCWQHLYQNKGIRVDRRIDTHCQSRWFLYKTG